MLKDIERAFFEHKPRRNYPVPFPLSFWFAGRRTGPETLRGFLQKQRESARFGFAERIGTPFAMKISESCNKDSGF
jgi:hypothetical protein